MPSPGKARLRAAVAVAALVLVCATCTSRWKRIPAEGEIAGQPVATTVDSAAARYYLENYLANTDREPARDRALEQAFAGLSHGPPRREDFQALSEKFSPDLAALHLAKVLAGEPRNAGLRAIFEGNLERVRRLSTGNGAALRRCIRELDLPPVWFVPGWFYESQPGTGASFIRQRSLLTRLGVASRLVRLVENAPVEQNAAILARAIQGLGPDDAVILVSASKGGAEAAHALGYLLPAEETRPVRAWINVGGLLRGSALADFAERWPVRWLAPIYFHVEGLDPGESVASLTTARSRARWARERIPEHVMIVNFVGVPLSGQISPGAEFGYARTRHLGPSDGLTAIVDAIAHGGRTIVQLGLDHYYRDPELDLKTLALAMTVAVKLGDAMPPSCQA